MDILDSVTSWFSTPTDDSPPAPSYDPSATMLSSKYSLANLIVTQQQLSRPNYPATQDQMNNLTIMADVKEQMDNEIGDSTILSGFRTKELQDALSAAGEPTATGTSFHELGRAIDISPIGMGITEFFGRLLANENLKNKFAEIAIKPSQNSIHLAINVPADTRDPKVLGLNSSNVYARLTLDDIVAYIAPYMPSADDAVNYADDQLVGSSNKMLYIVAAVALGAIAIMGSKKRA